MSEAMAKSVATLHVGYKAVAKDDGGAPSVGAGGAPPRRAGGMEADEEGEEEPARVVGGGLRSWPRALLLAVATVQGGATQEVALADRGEVSVSRQGLVVTVPMSLALKIVGTLGLATVAVLAVLWKLICGRGRVAPEAEGPRGEDEERKKGRGARRPRRVMCEVGVQGPVHYTGVGKATGGSYQHIVQGFRRGDEVTRVVADRPHAE